MLLGLQTRNRNSGVPALIVPFYADQICRQMRNPAELVSGRVPLPCSIGRICRICPGIG